MLLAKSVCIAKYLFGAFMIVRVLSQCKFVVGCLAGEAPKIHIVGDGYCWGSVLIGFL
jgi:hypothetical protein